MKEYKTRTALLLLYLYLVAGCYTSTKENTERTSASSPTNYKNQVRIKHAKGFTVQYHDHYKIVNIINPFSSSADSSGYLLLERGTDRPTGYEKHQLIEIPIRSMVAMSSMHIGLLGFLDAEQVLTGLGDLQYVFSPEVIKMIDSGKITQIGRNQGINAEKLISLHPDLVMDMGSPAGQTDQHPVLLQAGIPVLTNSEWVETSPLARAEWVKLLAVLLNKEELANARFDRIEKEYKRLVSLAKNATDKPGILSGLNTKDVWFMPTGDNFMSVFFEDAGGNYPWKNTHGTGSLTLNFETVYPEALLADFWLNVGFSNQDTRNSILQQDTRYSDFRAFKKGQMYSYNNRVNGRGANDFFESGVVAPEVVLADLIRILHPDLLPEHELVYYRQLK
ncbi:hypothetical protein DYBT9275_04100 [Dyadobacter sp. CECT 9275]|uniref:Fe/B12 periplasmic-binding domain-containing protein n=1 Tax=Dyadobacter helix TaxID=2822344 RepID=A0A916JEM7_9BACT|nr:ABC transporter substrate-binding protein [Dyadobacter sp. CECT 9275]CAG5007668.1 hypothetical protein DYBT9275_04100 [Dyadobacter sp. CECT 9275]